MSALKERYVGPYRLLNQLATGQSTEIWEAVLDSERKRVALKRLQKVKRNRQQLQFLRHEYAVGAKLEHPRIIKIEELGASSKELYLVMELFAVPNLKQLIYAGVDKIAHQAAGIIDQAAESLAYLAAQGWVHCDVKPDNFLVAPSGELKLIDFALATRPKTGLAKMLAMKVKPQGTMSYMSPEQILGKPVDFKADVYSLGCTVYELVSGKKPYTGMTTKELLQKHLAGQIPSLEAANRNITPEFGALIRRTLAKKPEERPTLSDFRREVQSIAVFKVRPKPPGETAAVSGLLDRDEPAAAATPRAKLDDSAEFDLGALLDQADSDAAPPRASGDDSAEFDLGELMAQAEESAGEEAADEHEEETFDVSPPARPKVESGSVFDLAEMFAASDSLRRDEDQDSPRPAPAKPASPAPAKPASKPSSTKDDDSLEFDM